MFPAWIPLCRLSYAPPTIKLYDNIDTRLRGPGRGTTRVHSSVSNPTDWQTQNLLISSYVLDGGTATPRSPLPQTACGWDPQARGSPLAPLFHLASAAGRDCRRLPDACEARRDGDGEGGSSEHSELIQWKERYPCYSTVSVATAAHLCECVLAKPTPGSSTCIHLSPTRRVKRTKPTQHRRTVT